MNGIPVLMYHALEDEDHPAGVKDPGEQLYVLRVEQFREQMSYLHREGFSTFLLHELFEMKEWPKKAVVITFDDGHASNCTLAFPILQELGFKAHFFVTTGWIGKPGYMTEEQIRSLHEAKMDIGSHGVTHAYLTDLDPVRLDCELFESRSALADITGNVPHCISIPGGRINKIVAHAVYMTGYRRLFTSRPGVVKENCGYYQIPRLALKNHTSLDEFRAALYGKPAWVLAAWYRYRLTSAARLIFGNNGYEVLRTLILKADLRKIS